MRYNLITILGILLFFSSCQKELSYEVGPLASGTLQNVAGDCLPKSVAGSFIAERDLDQSNYIEVSIDVAKPGHYSLFTDTVNGYSFKGQGNVTGVGPATVRLNGTGKPLVEGTDGFTVFFDSTSCAVQVTVLPVGTTPPPPTSGVYFPLTEGSWWSYDDGAGSDSIKTIVNGSGTLIGKTYQRFITSDNAGPFDTAYYRKDNATGFYYNYVDTSVFGVPGLTFSQAGLDVLFLKDALTTNTVFNSDHAASYQGVPVTIRFKSTCTDANASITVNGKNFTNVYKIQLVVQTSAGSTFQDISSPLDYYYAKDIGLIRVASSTDKQDIRNWKVN
jgi:hypothetical protein